MTSNELQKFQAILFKRNLSTFDDPDFPDKSLNRKFSSFVYFFFENMLLKSHTEEVAFCRDTQSPEKNPDPVNKKSPGYLEGKKS